MLNLKKFFNRKLNKKSENTSKDAISLADKNILKEDKIKDTIAVSPVSNSEVILEVNEVDAEIPNETIDDDKRLFLKIAGVAGLGLAAASLFPKSGDAYVAGSTPTSNVVGMKNIANAKINPATEDGNLAGIKTNTDTLSNPAAGGYIRQDSTGTIAKESGGNLANIKTNTDNLTSINSNISKFKFDGDNLLISGGAGGGGYEIVGLKDLNSNRINPATDESLVLLRRMVKIMESQATVDAANRQRVTVDSLGLLGATMPVSGSLTTAGTVSTVTSVTNMVTLAGQNQQMYQDPARNAYANGIRQNLSFS